MMDLFMVGLVDSFAIMLITILAYFYYRWWSNHPLYGQNKGPKVYPLVGSVIPLIRNIHRLPDYTFDLLSATPGLTIRDVRPDGIVTIITANPTNVEHMLKTNFENYPKGNFFYGILRELLGDGIFNADDKLWKIQRQQSSHVFTTRSLRDLVVKYAERETSDRLIPLLLQASETGQVLDLQDVFARFAFDNICQLGFGEDPSCLDISLPRVKFAEAFDRATLLTLDRLLTFPQSWWTIQRALNIGKPKQLRVAVSIIDEFAIGVIKKRRKEQSAASVDKGAQETIDGKADLLSMFMALVENDEQGEGEIRDALINHERQSLESRESRRDNSIMDVFLRDMVISFVLAGRDTTTSALSWFFWLLSNHPHVESAIRDEISRILSLRPPPIEGVSGEQISSTFSFDELKSMQYLHAALTESMRLYPPVPSDMKCARRADVWPDGTVIPVNSMVAYHPYSMGRLEELWGKDALLFKPDRWLKDGLFVPQSPYKYPVFQAGPRICLGKDMVMLQMKLVCAAILHDFHICVPEGHKPQYLTGLTLPIRDGLPVTVQKREVPA